jgi:predicted transcriptional regulator of viral defense system
MRPSANERAIELFRTHGGLLRTKAAMNLGIHPRTIYRMRQEGLIEQVSRGVFRLASLPGLARPDLSITALRVPRAVICLVSALAFHEATDEVPHEVQISLPRQTKSPTLEFPPLRVFWFSGPALTDGVETVTLDGVAVRVYDLPKTVVDCFRFRNKLGIDVAVDALNQAVRRHGTQPSELLRYARRCRIEKVMLPYIQAIR